MSQTEGKWASNELQSEENKYMEKNRKRKLKTPAQVAGLENFYNEHKYPTEEMKLEVAEELGLTEKQVSGWFCHRRLKDKRLLKDEAVANGRQDRSSGVIQDRGSGLGQDSCGSSKHGDYKYLDPKEVESQGLHNNGFSAADIAYGHRNHYTENISGMEDTSSESSSYLQDRLFPQGQDPYDMESSRYLTPNRALPPLNPKSAINMRHKPSGYLKVKGEIENAAITAVKKQFGRSYREDGPLLGVEFDPLPPGAFEGKNADPVHETYGVANPVLPNSPDISPVKRQPDLSSRYDTYYTKFSSQDSHIEGVDLGSLHDGSGFQDKQDKKARQSIKQRQTFYSNNHYPGRNSSLDLYEDDNGEASAYHSTKNHRMFITRGVEGMRSDSTSNQSDHYEENHMIKQTDLLPHGYDNFNLKNVQRSGHVKSKHSNSVRNSQIPVETEERGLSTRMAKEEMFKGGKKAKKKHRDADEARMLSKEITDAKRTKVDPLHQYHVKQAPIAEIDQRKIQRSAVPIPSSFSEDETADTSSSLG
ncbi:PREDICTED: homeobox-DDT domain protein RLT1-like isoform X1 [Lupinus angustifolius]|uniref:homeobox-DDT domain protein RLT1-like isoform X1 n=1 Tax=Lupinus angustifolius TaxID=3871 RepID=UPI00092FC5BF|nr:PREDICTED: homeobox-DDT domain protein RLT1-like isoform X1 [Lupinus angustifolius]